MLPSRIVVGFLLCGCLWNGFALADDLAKRATDGLLVFYDFHGDGPVVKDHPEFGQPLNLQIQDSEAVRRHDGSVELRKPTVIHSTGPARKVIDAVKRSGALSVEVWIRPKSLDQKGPARIVTLSQNPSERNLTLGQAADRIDVRLRTTKTSSNGIPATLSPDKSFRRSAAGKRGPPTHVVYTRARSGNTRIFIDGIQQTTNHVAGGVENWNGSFQLGLGNEFSGDRPWLGELFLVAIYNRSLSVAEVTQNFSAGFDADIGQREMDPLLASEHLFETQVAPLLSRHCLECHDSAVKEGGLDLSRKTNALRGGESGAAIVAGDSADSLLWKVVADDVMPSDRPPLADSEKRLLQNWIDSGASWPVEYVDPAIYRSEKDSGFNSELWVQRLTLSEYIATVRDSVGVDIADRATQLLPKETRADGFRNTAYNLNVDLKHVEAYAKLAQVIVANMNVDRFARRFSKKRKLTDDHMRKLIAEMGKHVLRGPLQEQEIVLYRGISTTVASAGGDFREAVATVLEAMLQSPRFLYRVENHQGDGAAWFVSEFELASRISYILWGAPPDKRLMKAADEGQLGDRKQLRIQVDRMLDDPRAQERSKQFAAQWLNLSRLKNMRPNQSRFPTWRRELADDMRQETIKYFQDVVWKQNRPLTDLLNAQFTYATPRLARHYGLDVQGDDWQKYDLTDVPSRGGLLTQASLLTIGGDDASMVTRGLFVLHDLLFSQVGDPPPGLDTTPVPASPGRSHRTIAAERVASKSCGGCHSRFEPLAYGLEMYDGLGSFHEADRHGNRLRQDGEIFFPGEAKPVSYETSAELMDLLAGSDRVGQCLTRKLTQFALGRPLFAADARSVRGIHQAAKAEGLTYRSVMKSIVLSDLVQKTRTEASP